MKRMLINAAETEEVRVAILDEDRLEDLDIEVGEGNSIKGNIYRAQVVNIEPAIQAAFVTYGGDRNGFLPLDEVNPRALVAVPRQGRSKKASALQPLGDEGVKPKMELLVQVTRDPIGQKGAALTSYIALPGQFLVYLPQTEGSGGISRRIEDSGERNRMKEKIAGLNLPPDTSVIVRTAGLERTTAELKREFKNLERLFKAIQKAYAGKKGPGLLYREEGVALRMVRDYFHDDIEEVWVDEQETYTAVQAFFELTLPKFVDRVKFYDGRVPLFTRYHVEEQIENTMTRQVPLVSGGSIVIDQTEALVAIDVNSGRTRQERTIEDTALKTNLEAAGEIARQLRLRNMGGIIVCDFIDMRDRKNRMKVQGALSKALSTDKAQITLGRIGQFGTIELLRQRMRTAGGTAGWTPCAACGGVGRVRNPVREAMAVLRALALEVASSKEGTLIDAKVPHDAAIYLLNEKRYEIRKLEIEGRVKIVIEPAHVKELSVQRTSEAFRFEDHPEEVVTRQQVRPGGAEGAVTLKDALAVASEEGDEEEEAIEDEAPPQAPPRSGRQGGTDDLGPRDQREPRGARQHREPGRGRTETAREKRRRERRERESRMISSYAAGEASDSIYDPFPSEPVRRHGEPPREPARESVTPREIVEAVRPAFDDDRFATDDEEAVPIGDESYPEDAAAAGGNGSDGGSAGSPDSEGGSGSVTGEAEAGDDGDLADDEEDEDAVNRALDSAVKQAAGGRPRRRGGRRGGRGRGGARPGGAAV